MTYNFKVEKRWMKRLIKIRKMNEKMNKDKKDSWKDEWK